MDPHSIKRRRRTTKQELQVLEGLYRESRNPSLEARQKACDAIGFEMKALQVWLQNRRQKEKKDAGKWKPAYTATGELTNNATSSASIYSQDKSQSASSSSRYDNDSSDNDNDNSTSSMSPDASDSHAPLYSNSSILSSTANQPHPNRAAASHHESHTLPPILDMHSSRHSSPMLPPMQLTLPPLASLIAPQAMSRDSPILPLVTRVEAVSREHALVHLPSSTMNHISDENTRPLQSYPLTSRSTSALSTRSLSSTSSMSSSTLTSNLADGVIARPPFSSTYVPVITAPLNTASTNVPVARSQPLLRRASSQYSLSMTQDGRAQMRVEEVTIPASVSSPVASHGHASASVLAQVRQRVDLADGTPQAVPTSASGQLASAPLPLSLSSVLTNNRLSINGFARVQSMPSFPTSTSATSLPVKRNTFPTTAEANVSHSSTSNIFAGGLRPGSPPKQRQSAVYSTSLLPFNRSSSSSSTYSHSQTRFQPSWQQQHNEDGRKELWQTLDSDPVEPEDEIILNRQRRMMASPARRHVIRMEDVLAGSSRRTLSSSDVASGMGGDEDVEDAGRKRKATEVFNSAPVEYTAGEAETELGEDNAAALSDEHTGPSKKKSKTKSASANKKVAHADEDADTFFAINEEVNKSLEQFDVSDSLKKNWAMAMVHNELSERGLAGCCSSSSTSRSAKSTKSKSIAKAKAKAKVNTTATASVNATERPNMTGRKRSYSKSMLSRSISLDRIMLHDDHDGNDGELSSSEEVEESARNVQKKSKMNQVESASVDGGRHDKRAALEAVSGMRVSPAIEDYAVAMSEQVATVSGERHATSTVNEEEEDTDKEPDLTFSTQASASFDSSMSRGDISELDNQLPFSKFATTRGLSSPSSSSDKENHSNDDVLGRMITSTPKKQAAARSSSANNILTMAAMKGYMTSPVKYHSKSPPILNKNGKIMTEVERDCAAVLCGLGVPDFS